MHYIELYLEIEASKIIAQYLHSTGIEPDIEYGTMDEQMEFIPSRIVKLDNSVARVTTMELEDKVYGCLKKSLEQKFGIKINHKTE